MNFFLSNMKNVEVEPMADYENAAWNFEDYEGKFYLAQFVDTDFDLYEVNPDDGDCIDAGLCDADMEVVKAHFSKLRDQDFVICV